MVVGLASARAMDLGAYEATYPQGMALPEKEPGVYEGVARLEFDLPEGRIWRAVADVINKNERYWYGDHRVVSTLYINGQKAERSGARQLYHLAPVDIAPYLRPGGRNVIGFYGLREGNPPPLSLIADVVMHSGEVIRIQSGPHWKVAAGAPAGWNQVGFDDSDWSAPEQSTGVWFNVRAFRTKMCLPTYRGPLFIENPNGQFLFFRDDRPVTVEVRVPGGWADRTPALTWHLGAADAEGMVEPADRGTISEFDTRGDSLVYRLDLGTREDGVYVMALVLEDAQDNVLAERPPEPVVVLQTLEQQVVPGTAYTEGLDLVLEDTIDFTDPDDPHPWHEWATEHFKQRARTVETPTIVRSGDLAYREVGADAWASGFSYRIEFQEPGSLYLMELTYPDNTYREIEVAVSSKKDGVRFASQAGVGVETGLKFFTTGAMQTLRWIQVADHGPHSVDILNGFPAGQGPAAVGRLRIYRIAGDLPSVGAGTSRWYGIHTERQFFTSGFGRNFGMDRPLSEAEQEAEKRMPVLRTYLKDLAWMKAAAETYAQYLKFAGHNAQVIGCYQYTSMNTPYAYISDIADARVPWGTRSMLAHVFDVNEIDFFAGLEFSQSYEVGSNVSDAEVAQGADTINMVDAQGRQRDYQDSITMVPNWLHPSVEAAYLRVVARMNDTFDHLPNYRGIHQLIGPMQYGTGYWMPAVGDGEKWEQPLLYSFDDVTMGLFEQETGIDLPAGPRDPQRFQKRASFIENDPQVRARFLQWRCDKFTELMTKTADLVAADRDLQFVNIQGFENRDTFAYYHESGRTLPDILDDFAIDLDALKGIDNFWLGRWTISWRRAGRRNSLSPHQDPLLWLAREEPGFIAAHASPTNRYVFCRTSWHESHPVTGGITAGEDDPWGELIRGTDWIQNRTELTIMPQPSGAFAREALAQGLITADPQLLLSGFTDVNLNLGHEQVIRELVKPFTHLPAQRFEPVLNTGLQTNLAIRVLNRDADAWCYVVNPGFWPFRGTVTLTSGAELVSVPDGERVADAGETELAIELAPFAMRAFRTDSPELSILGYTTGELSGPRIESLRAIPRRVAALCQSPATRNALSEEERTYMQAAAQEIQATVDAGEYARAWSMIKRPRFWQARLHLEKAADKLSALPEDVRTVAASDNIQGLPELVARRAQAPITVNGDLDEPAWAGRPFQTGFVTSEKMRSMAQTGLKAAYTEDALYLAFACADQDVSELRATAKGEDEMWSSRDDVIAVFLQPDPDKRVYYQMVFNAAGVRFDQRVAGGERDYAFAPDWQAAASRHQGYWTAEVAFPLEAFGLTAIGDAWRMNVFRRFRKDEIQASSWSWTPGDWHTVDRFGWLRIED